MATSAASSARWSRAACNSVSGSLSKEMQRRTFLSAATAAGMPLLAQKRKTILLRTAWQRRNIGDVCFTPSMLSALEEYIPEARVICWMASSHDDVNAMLRRAHPKAELLHAQFGAKGQEIDPALAKAIGEADLFLFNSGPIFSYGLHETYSWDSSMPNALFAMYAKERGVPYGMYGQSYDRFAWPSPILFRRVLGDAAFVYTRDTNSLKYLQSLEVKPKVMDLGPDIAFHFQLRNDAPAHEFLRAKGLEKGKFLVTMVHYATMDRPGVKDHGASHLEKHRAVLQRWVGETNLPILVVAEDEREVELGKKWLIDPMPTEVQKKMILKDNAFWLPDEALSLYLQAHSLFTPEPHSMIFALANGIPCIHLYDFAYGRKFQMFNDFGIAEWNFDMRATEAAPMSGALMNVYKDRPAALKKVAALQKRVKSKMDACFNVVRSSLRA
jgi:polysaccharide pyruvyl transferase WcaK-like protein